MKYIKHNKTKLLTAIVLAVLSSVCFFYPAMPKIYVTDTYLINNHRFVTAFWVTIILFVLYYVYLLSYSFIYNKLGVFPSVKSKSKIFFHRVLFRTAIFVLTMIVLFTAAIVVNVNIYIYHLGQVVTDSLIVLPLSGH